MNNPPAQLVTISLSLEELSLSLGLLNLRDMANMIIRSIYPDLNETQMGLRLKSATHSLLARGWIEIGENRKPYLGPELERVVAPMATYNRLLQLINNSKDGIKRSTLYIQSGKGFTSQTIDRGVIRILDHGEATLLSSYVLSYFPNFGRGKYVSDVGRAPAGLLDYKGDKWKDSIGEILKANGWTPSDVKAIIEDLANPLYKGIIVLKEASSKMTVERSRKAPQHSLALVQGEKRSWLLDHPQESHQLGTAHLMDRRTFLEFIGKLLG